MPLLDVTGRVRHFYDNHPYPPPVGDLEQYQRRWQDPQRRRADFHLFWPDRKYREDQSILIAGCGTSQAAKHALHWPYAQVTGIDCSATSIRHTEQLKKQHGLTNLLVHQLAIENVGALGTSFDQIICTGVLHHLEDPGAGLRALRSVLKPDGAMHLMVYAPYGRTGIYMLQEFCRRVGVRATQTGIRDLIRAMDVLPTGHPLRAILTQAPELRDEAALADSLLHPQDRAYSVTQLFHLIEDAGLVFGRWLRQAPYSVHCGVISQIPQAGDLARLPWQEQCAAIELFRGTMSRHSAVVYRNDYSRGSSCTAFGEDDWRRCVPIRMPDTICVQERVPSWAAAVLINRAHTYPDLFLAIGPAEKKLFDAIDGQRTIWEIAERMLPTADPAMCRSFFEQLWRHDQVVFATRVQEPKPVESPLSVVTLSNLNGLHLDEQRVESQDRQCQRV